LLIFLLCLFFKKKIKKHELMEKNRTGLGFFSNIFHQYQQTHDQAQ